MSTLFCWWGFIFAVSDASLQVQVTLARGVVAREEKGTLLFILSLRMLYKDQGSGTSTSWLFGQQGRDREQISCASGYAGFSPRAIGRRESSGVFCSSSLTTHNNALGG